MVKRILKILCEDVKEDKASLDLSKVPGLKVTVEKIKPYFHYVDPKDAEVVYQCEVCKGYYETKHKAKKCESLPTKKYNFKKNDIVKIIELFGNLEKLPYFSTFIGRKAKILKRGRGRLFGIKEYEARHVNHYYLDSSAFELIESGEEIVFDDFLAKLPIPEYCLEKVVNEQP